jgi:hypothetical protein
MKNKEVKEMVGEVVKNVTEEVADTESVNVKESDEVVVGDNNIAKFIKDHKKEILIGAISICVIAGIAYITYKTGYKHGVKANTFIPGEKCETTGYLTEDGSIYKLGFEGPTYGCGMQIFGVEWSASDAIDVAKDILKDLGALKEVVDIPGEAVKEVI